MKILYLDHAPYEGGAEVSLKELVMHLDSRQFVSVVAAPARALYMIQLHEKDIECVNFRFHWKQYSMFFPLIWDLLDLIRLIQRVKPDIIHANTRVTTILLGMLYRLRGLGGALKSARYINHVRDKDSLPAWKFKLVNSCDQLITNSQQVKRFLVEGGVSASKIQVVYNGIDLTRFKPRCAESNSTASILTAIGQIYPRKGFEYLIEALPEITKEFPRLRLRIVGQDPTASQVNLIQLRVIAKQLGVFENIDWLGYRRDVPDILADTNIFVLPSLEEPFGRVLIEAMAMKVPIVATRVGGIPEIVEDGKTGFLVPPRNSQQLASNIIKLLRNSDLARQMGEKGRRKVEEKFSLRKHVGEVSKIYDKVMS
ncbi:glycosyltransferase family 4 protein [Patescibacteria group bacterium]|nr:glycosyltransferase family 4 protein [Patescibacteria group bacterium]